MPRSKPRKPPATRVVTKTVRTVAAPATAVNTTWEMPIGSSGWWTTSGGRVVAPAWETGKLTGNLLAFTSLHEPGRDMLAHPMQEILKASLYPPVDVVNGNNKGEYLAMFRRLCSHPDVVFVR